MTPLTGQNLLLHTDLGLFKIKTNGLIDSTFSVNGTLRKGNENIYWLYQLGESTYFQELDNGRIFCAGNFDSYDSLPAPGFAILKNNGALDTAIAPFSQFDYFQSKMKFAPGVGNVISGFGTIKPRLGPLQKGFFTGKLNFTGFQMTLTGSARGAMNRVPLIVKLKKDVFIVRADQNLYNRKYYTTDIKIDGLGNPDTNFRLKGLDQIENAWTFPSKSILVQGLRQNMRYIQIYDSLLNPIGPDTTGWVVRIDQEVTHAKPYGNNLMISGYFDFIGSTPANSIVIISDQGLISYPSFMSTPMSRIRAIETYKDGRVLVAMGNDITRYLINGDADSTFNGINRASSKMQLLSNKKILISDNIYGRIRKLDSNGILDNTFTFVQFDITFQEDPTSVFDIFTYSDDKIIACGNFRSYFGFSGRGLIGLLANGQIDTSFRLGTSFGGPFRPSINSMVPLDNGRFLVGGEFTSYKGVGRNNIARIYYQRADVLTDSVAGKRFCKAGIQKIAYRCQAFEPEDSLRLQISDSSGAFANARVLKTVKAKQQDSVSFSFPSNLLAGNKYRFRWVATAPTAKICFPSESFSITEPLVPQVAILSNTSRDTLCFGEVLKLKLTLQNQGSLPIYKWWVNNIANPGTADSLFFSAQMIDSVSVRVEMRSSIACVAPALVQAVKKYVLIKPGVDLGPDTSLCRKPGFYALPLVNNGNVLSWVASAGLALTGVSTAVVGIFNGKLNTSTFGCKAVDSVRIQVVAKPIISLSISPSSDSIKLSPAGLVNIRWFYNNALLPGQSNNYLSNPETGAYFSIAQNTTGCLDTSEVFLFTFIENQVVSGSVILYPNPAKTTLYLQAQSLERQTIHISDAMGRKVKTFATYPKQGLNIESLPPGLYLIGLKSEKENQILRFWKE